MMRTCIFCGDVNMVTHKLITLQSIEKMIAKQKAADIDCPVLNLIHTLVQCYRRQVGISIKDEKAITHLSVVKGKAVQPKHSSQKKRAKQKLRGHAVATTCMCCHHWVTRRQKQAITPFPMQNLHWFIKTLRCCENTRCDIRVITRMVCCISRHKKNHYRSLFLPAELDLMKSLTSLCKNKPKPSIDTLKFLIGKFWHAQNNNTIFLPSAAIAELLRAKKTETTGLNVHESV